jgi:phage-related minor tail protein
MKSLEALKTDKSVFSIGLALSDGWKYVSKNLGYYILGGIIAVVISGAVSIIPIVGGVVNNLILSPCLMAGAVYVTWHISQG